MRRRSVLFAVPALMLTAAGCGSDDGKSGASASSSPSATGTAAGTPTPSATPTLKTVSGPLPALTGGTKFGQKPVVAKGAGAPAKNLAVKALIPGDGPAIVAGDYLQVNYLGQIWNTAKVFDTSFGRAPYTNVIGQQKFITGFDQAMIGQKANSRVQMSIPPDLGYGTAGNPQAGITGTDTLVFVVDVLKVYNGKSSSHGKVVPQTDATVPKVGTNTDGKSPSITVPKGKAPTKLVSEYILEGDGAAVKASDTLLLQYKGVVWDTGKEFDSTYKRGELAAFPLAQLIPGWQKGLPGKKVGSRVVLVTPPADAYGAKPPSGSGIPANATLVFTFDILAIL